MRLGPPSPSSGPIRSRHCAWRDSLTSRDTQCGVTPSATSYVNFSDTIVDNSRATSCGAPRDLTRPKGLLLGILVGVGLVLKF
jgi:hypothetical protein